VLLDLLFPRRCVVCSLPGAALCPRCTISLPRIEGPLCARCGTPTAWPVARCRECAGRRLSFASARAAVAYDGPARALVAGWKDRGLRPLGREFAGFVVEVVPRTSAHALTFVPGDAERSLKRGQNAAEALARELGPRWGLPVERLLRRPEHGRPQRGLSREERRKNVRNTFTAVARPPVDVALVDDVYTTGATVAAAATELRRAGARSVHVVTFARTVRR